MRLTPMKEYGPYWWYAFAALLFFFDLVGNALLEKQFFALVLCAYVLQLYKPLHKARLTTLALFACLESLVWHDSTAIQLPVLVLATLGAYVLQHAFYKTPYQPYGLLIAVLVMNSSIEYFILGLPVALPYTIMKISANLFLLWCFSLK